MGSHHVFLETCEDVEIEMETDQLDLVACLGEVMDLGLIRLMIVYPDN